MNNERGAPWTELGDQAALKIQELRKNGTIDDTQPLFRIDYRNEAARAPFLFDLANGKLHRADCRSIPRDSKAALYGVWEPDDADLKLICSKCKPDMKKREPVKKDISSDMIYGFLSMLDQFGSVLGERGKEYRNSDRGKALEKAFQAVTSNLDHRQKEALQTLSSVMDGLFEIIKGCNDSLNQREKGKAPRGESKNGKGRPSPVARQKKGASRSGNKKSLTNK